MPQILRQDNIPKLVVASTTTATLAITSGGQSTLISVGGQQYQVSSLITLNAATVGANGLDAGSLGVSQLWYVYAIAHQTSFAMALVASLSATPTMPTGYGTAYKLVGGFNTNASSQVSFTVTPEDGNVYPVSAGFVLGRTDGLAVPAGYIGEYREVISTGYVSMSPNVYSDGGCAGILLPIGTWDVHTTGAIVPNVTTTLGYIYRFVGTAAGNSGAGLDEDRNLFGSYHGGIANSNGDGMYGSSVPVRIDVSTPTMYYAKIRAGFAVSTCQGKASIFARRVG